MKGLLFVLALAGVAAAGKKSVTTYTAEAKQKELTQLRDTGGVGTADSALVVAGGALVGLASWAVMSL